MTSSLTTQPLIENKKIIELNLSVLLRLNPFKIQYHNLKTYLQLLVSFVWAIFSQKTISLQIGLKHTFL